MKKFTLVLILLSIFMLGLLPGINPASSQSALAGKKVLIDPGHGGSDPGSTECLGLYESDANLDIAMRLKALIEADGGEGFLIRDDDYYMTNADRYNLANQEGGDVLVSIHLNGWYDHTMNYTQGLYAKYRKDFLLTSVIHETLAAELGIDDGGLRQFASGVLLKSDMPATLQEAVFISNTEECQKLTNGSGDRQQEIATALHHGLIAWFNDPQVFNPGKRK